MDDTSGTTLPAPHRQGATANARRVAVFVAALALTAAVGWQAGRLLNSNPPEPAAVPTSAPRGLDDRGETP